MSKSNFGISYVMPYLLLMPCLICCLALSIEDLRSRRIPRAWVGAGVALQLIVFICWCAFNGVWGTLLTAVTLAVVCALLQLAISLARPGALGLGDVSCTLLAGLAVAFFGPDAILVWWCLMGILGVTAIALFARAGASIAFAPVISISAVGAIFVDSAFF